MGSNVELRQIYYVCPNTGDEVLTGFVDERSEDWELTFFQHLCTLCGEEHTVERPEDGE